MKPQPTLNYVSRIGKKTINSSPCHPELVSGSSHRQKYSAICTQKTNVGLKAQPTLISISPRRRSIVMQGLSSHSPRKVAFTLAEVLITLGIIGVVAAMTMPTLMAKYQKKVVATHLKKYYSMMSQAIKLAEAENGEMKYWLPDCYGQDQCFRDWYNKYLDKHIKSIKKDDSNVNFYKVAFADGTGFNAYVPASLSSDFGNIIHIDYCINFKKCDYDKFDGQNSFLFSITTDGKFIASYAATQNYTRSKLLDLCAKGNSDNADVSSVGRRHACTRLIQIDGWEIKPDYPWDQVIITN